MPTTYTKLSFLSWNPHPNSRLPATRRPQQPRFLTLLLGLVCLSIPKVLLVFKEDGDRVFMDILHKALEKNLEKKNVKSINENIFNHHLSHQEEKSETFKIKRFSRGCEQSKHSKEDVLEKNINKRKETILTKR